jgi:Tfp pilus assembly protein PilW
MIAMVMFVFVIAATSQIFTGLLTQFKQQSKIAETNIEGIVGLDMMRRDLEHAETWSSAGNPPTIAGYTEVPAGNAGAAYNECVGAHRCTEGLSPAGSGAGYNGSDELVIRGTNVARSRASMDCYSEYRKCKSKRIVR